MTSFNDTFLPTIDTLGTYPPERFEKLIQPCLSSRTWRLNNLYHIINKEGRDVRFQFNWAQEDFHINRWYLNIILKARQLGFTTYMCILQLDAALFKMNTHCGIIAQSLDAAEEFFSRKVEYAYDNMLSFIRERIPTAKRRAKKLEFSNGSSITVSTTFRSGTLQLLHISEFGKICAERPHRAKEIVTGALEAVAAGQFVSIESTAEGQQGYFYDYCQRAQELMLQDVPLSKLDFKFFFYPWWKNPEYVIREYSSIPILQNIAEYFEELELKSSIKLHPAQKAWYMKKFERLGSDIKREYPSTPEEAFERSIEGSYFRTEFMKLYERGQITKIPIEDGLPVYTFWDLGMNDCMAIWFMQLVGREPRFIDYYENNHEGLQHYARVLRERGHTYAAHFAPHDIEVQEMGTGKTRKQTAAEYGINFSTVPRVKDKRDSIEAARRYLPQCWFDEERCSVGIERLKGYRKAYNPRTESFHSHPLHDINSNGADAFQTFAMGFDTMSGASMVRARPVAPQDTAGWC